MNNVLCLKWGKRYGAECVNRLYRSVKANLSGPFRFVCVTDDPTGLAGGVEAVAFPEKPASMVLNECYPAWPNLLSKLLVFRSGFAGLEGPTLFLDIDQVITGNLDCFFDYRPGEFCIIHNWIEFRKRLFRKAPFVGNSSCFRFEAGGKFNYVYEKFVAEMAQAMDMEVFSTEQRFMTHAVGEKNVNWWPDNFVRSFKRSCTWPWPLNHFLAPRFDPDTRILCFHGEPSPEQAIAGYRGRHLNTWTRPAPWVKGLMERYG